MSLPPFAGSPIGTHTAPAGRWSSQVRHAGLTALAINRPITGRTPARYHCTLYNELFSRLLKTGNTPHWRLSLVEGIAFALPDQSTMGKSCPELSTLPGVRLKFRAKEHLPLRAQRAQRRSRDKCLAYLTCVSLCILRGSAVKRFFFQSWEHASLPVSRLTGCEKSCYPELALSLALTIED